MGIGEAITTSLAHDGANLVLFSRSEVDEKTYTCISEDVLADMGYVIVYRINSRS